MKQVGDAMHDFQGIRYIRSYHPFKHGKLNFQTSLKPIYIITIVKN
ncbi:MAG TPA: hypothetical protein VG621_00755 [Candidatus Paceibacterota bacterium]|nr:hypothetical protein [Candidatus Paceibacterota bacterium]